MRASIVSLFAFLSVLVGGGPALAQPAPNVVVEKDVIYSRDQGSALLADIAYPRAGRGLPAIIYVHGGRWRGGARDQENALDVAKWAANGFFAMTIDYRLVGATPAPAPYQDTLSAVRFVHANAQKYGIDTNRIYMIGDSSGGHLVSLVATLGKGPYPVTGSWPDASTDVRAVISVSGAYDLTTLSWGDLWTPETGPASVARQLGSPIRAVSAKTKPILVIHSDDDRSVPIQQAVEMTAALNRAGVFNQFIHATNRGHMRITDQVVQETRDFIAQVERNGR